MNYLDVTKKYEHFGNLRWIEIMQSIVLNEIIADVVWLSLDYRIQESNFNAFSIRTSERSLFKESSYTLSFLN